MNSPVTIWREHKNLHKYLGKKGKVLVWTKILIPPLGFEHQVPYLVGIIQFEDPSTRFAKASARRASSGQVRMPLQIVDCEEQNLKPNQKVITVIRKIGKAKSEDVIEYGVKVKPI